jgi:hypothetical protein
VDSEEGGDEKGEETVGGDFFEKDREQKGAEEMEKEIGEVVDGRVKPSDGIVSHVGNGLEWPVVGGWGSGVTVKEVGLKGEVEVETVANVIVFEDESGVVPEETVMGCVAIGKHGENSQKQQHLGTSQ